MTAATIDERKPEAHPHDTKGAIPDRPPIEVLRACSALRPGAAVAAVAMEWAGVAAAIVLCQLAPEGPARYLSLAVALPFIGARQHALAVIGHDAVHYRLLPGKRLNDLFGNLAVLWPVFISVDGFRRHHSTHHQFTNAEGDGNRFLWNTHTADGRLAPEWQYPKGPAGLALKIARRAAVFTGARWIVRGLLGSFVVREAPALIALRVAYYAAAAAALTALGLWKAFALYWLLPFCTWHVAIQYVRLVCEHSAVGSEREAYRVTRTTVPTWLESLFVLPRNIGYHLEHHWYPSVPFYNLPRLHEALMSQPGYRSSANVHRSIVSALRECAGRPRLCLECSPPSS